MHLLNEITQEIHFFAYLPVFVQNPLKLKLVHGKPALSSIKKTVGLHCP
jgi:hypothetical protein